MAPEKETLPETETAPEKEAPDADRLAKMRALALQRGNELQQKKMRARERQEERRQAAVDLQHTEPPSETETVAHVGEKRKHDTINAADGKKASKPIELDGSGGSDTESGGAEAEAEPAPREERPLRTFHLMSSHNPPLCLSISEADMRPSPAPATNLSTLTTDPLAAALAKHQKKEKQKQQAVELAARLNAAGGPAPETPAFREVLAAHGAESAAPSDSQ